ncbi:MAG: hypothetical protein ABSA05_14370 [Opitutaceae bacterium]
MQDPIHKVIITGTGRAGTTFLVRLLSECGLDTGFSRRTWRRDYYAHGQAGLERSIISPRAPYIVKNPDLCESLPAVLATGRFVIDRAIVPIRDLESAAMSRARVGGRNGSLHGGLWKTGDPAAQKAVLGELFHGLMHTLAEHDIPITLILFPRMVEDADYTYDKLHFLVGKIPRPRFHRIFGRIADPGLVHQFRPNPAAPAPMLPPAEFERARREYGRRRQLGPASVRLGMAVAFLILLFGIWHFRARLGEIETAHRSFAARLGFLTP